MKKTKYFEKIPERIIRILRPKVNVIKLFFGGNLDIPKIKKFNKVCYDV